ncbi:MAG: ribosomal-processing cysteine protease Prp [Clostridia bacterium]|nr:ribosomal-processing cysteine protease Prp [Clostridia bacterium]
MITAVIAPDKADLSMRLTVTGHSGYAPSGSDVVCAWVSSLVQTFAETVAMMHRNGDLLSCEGAIEPGKADIRCRCDTEEEWRILCLTLGFVQTGLSLLARDYPQYITVNSA